MKMSDQQAAEMLKLLDRLASALETGNEILWVTLTSEQQEKFVEGLPENQEQNHG